MSTEGSGGDAEAQPGIEELLKLWRVERLADGSVRIKGKRESWWSVNAAPMGCVWFGLGPIGLLYVVWKHAEVERDSITGLVFVTMALIVTLVPVFAADRGSWLTLSARGLRVDTVWPLGVRSFRRLPWEQIKGLTLVGPTLNLEIWFDLEPSGKLVVPSGRLPVPPADIWDWILAEAPLPEQVRELMVAEVRRVRGIEAQDNRTMAGGPHPLGQSLLENSPDCVRVRYRGLGGSSQIMGSYVAVLLVPTLPGLLMLIESQSTGVLWAGWALFGMGLLGMALLITASSVSREEFVATPDGLRVARRSLFGTRVCTLDKRPDSISLPKRWWVWLFWPHLAVTSGDTTLRFGSVLQHQELLWLLVRLQALWGLTSEELDGPAREER